MLKKLLPIAFTLMLTLAFHPSAHANEAGVKKAMEAKLGVKITSVTKTPYLGLYEIYADDQILYTDEKQSVIIAGALVDGKTMKNHTAERMQKLSAINFSELPLEYAVKRVLGDGKRVLVTFEDPNCGYCKKLAKDLAKLDNVTIYTFLYPILSPDSLEKTKQVWCSPDKTRAWVDLIQDGKAPAANGNCDTTAIKKTVELGRRLNITGTPALIFADGQRVLGAVPLTEIEQKLAAAPALNSPK